MKSRPPPAAGTIRLADVILNSRNCRSYSHAMRDPQGSQVSTLRFLILAHFTLQDSHIGYRDHLGEERTLIAHESVSPTLIPQRSWIDAHSPA
jgi:hypothetical protein